LQHYDPQRIEFPAEPLGGSPTMNRLLLFVFAAVLALWGQSSSLTLSDHEAIVAQTSRQILQGDGWIIPQENGHPWIRKPPLANWSVALAAMASDPADQALPVSAFSARLPSAIACILTVFVVYGLGRSMFSHQTGTLAGAIMAFSVGGFYFAHNAQIEMTLVLFCAAAFACFWMATEGGRPRFIVLFYAALGVSMMAKAPLPVAVVCLPLFIWWFLTVPACFPRKPETGRIATYLRSLTKRLSLNTGLLARIAARLSEFAHFLVCLLGPQVRRLPSILPISGIAVAVLICVPWPLYVYLTVDNALALWRIEFAGRSAGELGESGGFWYYIPIAFLYMVPFCLSLPEALASPFLRIHASRRKPLLFLLTWIVVGTAFITTSPFKRPHYLATAIPALALILAPTLEYLFLSARDMSRRALNFALIGGWILIPLSAIGGGFLVRYEAPAILNSYIVLAVLFSLGMLIATRLFATHRRMLSLCTLFLTTMGSFMWGYDALTRSSLWQAESRRIVAEFQARSIGPEDRITWVAGRPNATVAFYLGREIPPLFSAAEIAPMRGSRTEISRELLVKGANRLEERLSSDTPEYFVLKSRDWNRLRDAAEAPAREVFRTTGRDEEDTEDDWVVITNDWNTKG
jgi:4-amino-4-deoxy-L-arabinose transferase-like glycosyltransferase